MRDWIENVMSLIGILANPAVLIVVLCWVGIVYAINRRLLPRIRKRRAALATRGWSTGAARVLRQHASGVGSEDVRVMRLPRRNLWVAVFSLLLFGGCAVYFWLVILPDPTERTSQTWLSFGIACAFSGVALWRAQESFNRIEVSTDAIVYQRLWRRPEQFALSSIVGAKPVSQNPARGVILLFSDNRSLRLLATYEGYAEILGQLQGKHVELEQLLQMGRLVQSTIAGKDG